MPHRRVKFEWPSDDVFSKMWWRAFSTWDELDYSRRIKTRESDRFRQHTGLEKSKLSLSLRVFYDKYSAGLQTRNCGAHPPLNFRFKITVADNRHTHTATMWTGKSRIHKHTHQVTNINRNRFLYCWAEEWSTVHWLAARLPWQQNRNEKRSSFFNWCCTCRPLSLRFYWENGWLSKLRAVSAINCISFTYY